MTGKSPGTVLQDPTELYRLLIESVRDYAIFALDPGGYILSWNPGAERFKGYRASEIIGKHFSIFYPREKVEEGFPDYELEVAAQVGRFEDEGWRVRKDGSRFWANVVITALRDPRGELVGYAKVTRDLTERRAAEEALRESEERFRRLVEGVRDYAIFMLSPEGNVASWNRGAERINGYTADEITGEHFSRFYPPEDIASGKPGRELEIAAAEGQYEEEGWRLRKGGTRFWANVLITAIRAHDGRLIGFAKVTRDLTERRAAELRALEDARHVAAEEAARRAAEERERELRALATQLEQQATALDNANRAKADFLAAMSHELRTPLNAIGGYTSLIAMGMSGPITEQQGKQLERIQRSQQHLLGIINDILNFSRVDAGHLTYELTSVRVADAVDAVSKMIAPMADAKQLTFEAAGAGTGADVAVVADRGKLEQILINLLSNAVKFTDEGGRVTISHAAQPGTVTIAVRDTGVGIPADQLDRIFEPFVQVGRSLTRTQEGTGLGLAISRDLARGMRGDLSAASVPGEGSTFTLTLPRARA